nr:PREDICTED: uncharacterized protein LOC105670835 [Linepithema humile]
MSIRTTIDSPLANVASEIEERRCNLLGRRRDLRNKVTTMERSIPALLAYNMWMAEQDCRDTPYHKVREIMNKFSPQPDPADRLLAELRNTVDDLHQETAQLHDKIIDTDVQLEEAGMKLESLELANREMEEKLMGLQNEVRRHSTPSLHSIHSEDLICLKKIRQLAEEELKLKNCIKELESKEITYRRHMDKLLSCKKFQRDSKKLKESMTKNVRESKGTRREQYSLEDRKYNVTRKKYALKDKGRACCTCATSVTLTGYEETSKKFEACEEFCSSLSCCVPLDSRAPCATTSQSRDCKACYKSCKQISTAIVKSKSHSPKSPCESLFAITSKTDVPQSLKQLTLSSVPCNPGKTCNECMQTPAACKQIISCKCDCEGKCARKFSTAPCDCSIKSLDKSYRLATSRMLRSGSEVDDSNSDEEFCECCSCGCGGSETSS